MAYSKRFLKKKKRSSWIDFCNKLNRETTSTKIWRNIKKLNRISVKNSIAINEKLALKILDSIAPTAVVNEQSRPPHKDHDDFLALPFTLREVQQALTCTKNSAPGIDGIPYILLKHLPMELLNSLVSIFNAMWIEGAEIKDLKKIVIIPIPKTNSNTSDPLSFRPISLLPCILKTYERIIKNRLEWWLEQNNTLPSRQYGFRKQMGTIDAVTDLVTGIQLGFSRNVYTGVLFLDLKNAYNTVELDILEKKLCQLKMSHQVAKNIVSIFRERWVYVRAQNNELIGPRLINCGLPQGSILSPTMFNLYTVDLHSIGDRNKKIIQYADDICIVTEGKTLDKLKHNLAIAMSLSNKWFLTNGFELSPNKSAVVVFSRHRKLPDNQFNFDNISIPIKESVKYLGFIIDKKLKWTFHVNHLVQKCERYLNLLRIIAKVRWGADSTVTRLFYNACIRSHLDYGCVIFASANSTQLKRLTIIQNKALRICVGAMRSTPVEALYVEAREPPLDLRRTYLAAKYILKVQLAKQNNIIDSIHKLSIYDLISPYWAKRPSPPLASAYTYIRKHNISLSTPTFPNINFFEFNYPIQVFSIDYSGDPLKDKSIHADIIENLPSTTIIYTDASRSVKGCGCAFYDANNNVSRKFRLNDNLNIYSGEAKAISEALAYVLQINTRNVAIMSDSKSVLQAIAHRKWYSKTHPEVLNIVSLCANLRAHHISIKFFWVKGHVGIVNNEKVDVLAKESIKIPEIDDNKFYETEALHIIKTDWLKNNWEQRWRLYGRGCSSQYYKIHPSIFHSRWHENRTISRFCYSTIARLKFGHGLFPAHLYKLNIIGSPSCECGHEVADLNHIILACPKSEQRRRKLIEDLVSLKVKFPTNVVDLLALNNIHIYTAIMKFIRDSNVRI